MKKLIASVLTACLTVPCASAPAFAESRTLAINDATQNKDEIHILYNDGMVEYVDVKPINSSDRIMIPFRVALEDMGATVDYDDSQRLVTAKKGDITIRFTLMDDTIYIDNNGEQSTMQMDVPMIIVNDRTLVPIRFMSEAFGMQVGWDGNTQTVIIMDYDDYFDKLAVSITPNLEKLNALRSVNYNKNNAQFDLSYGVETDSYGTEISANGKIDSVIDNDRSQAKLNLSMTTENLSFDNTDMDVIIKDNKIYIRTDVLKQIKNNDENQFLIAALIQSDNNFWYTIDIDKLFGSIKVGDMTLNTIKAFFDPNSGTDLRNILLGSMTTEGDAVYDEAISLATTMDILEEIDKRITVTEGGDGSYGVSLNLESKDFVKILSDITGIPIDNENLYSGNKVKISIEGNGITQTTNADVALMVDDTEGSYSIKFNVKSTASHDDNASVDEPPAVSYDISNLLVNLLKK